MSDDAPGNPPHFVPPVSTFTGPVGELIAQRMLAPPPRPGVLAIVDHFEILRVLGGGGMGIVLLARDSATGREVAVKLVKSDLVTNQHAVHRFLKETGHLKRLQHTNIVPVEEISDRPEGPYFVMPYFEKGSLAGRIKPGQPLVTESILDIAIQVAEGLSFAHRSGIIHRDLKPANILLGASGVVCLADFGLARSMFNDTIVDVENRQLEGTAPYVSPAIAAGDAEDTRCDIYSFGALLYEMLTGLPPYQGRGTKEILSQILAGPPKPIASLNPSADRGLVAVAEGCMARELRDRYADMRDVLNDLRRVQQNKPPIGRRSGEPARGIPKPLVVAACVVGIALLGWAGTIYSRSHARTTTPPTNSKPAGTSNTVAATPLPVVAPVPKTTLTNPPTPVIAPVVSNTNTVSLIFVASTNRDSNVPMQVAVTNLPVVAITNLPPAVKPVIKPVAPTTPVQLVVKDIALLAANGLSEAVISTFAKANPLSSPLTAGEVEYLWANGVSQNVVDLLRQSKSAPVAVTNQPIVVPQNAEVHSLVKTAYEKHTLHEDREAVTYCNRALKLDPDNADAWCVKAISEDTLHNTAAAMTGYSTFLKLPASQTAQYAAWRTYASTRLKALSGW